MDKIGREQQETARDIRHTKRSNIQRKVNKQKGKKGFEISSFLNVIHFLSSNSYQKYNYLFLYKKDFLTFSISIINKDICILVRAYVCIDR